MTQTLADFNNLGPWLEEKLRERQMSMEELSRECGLSRAALYFYVNDTYRPTAENMLRICQALGVPYEEGLQQYTPRKPGRPRLRDDNGKRPA